MTGGSYEDGIRHSEKYESDGRYYLSWNSAQVLGPSFGRGCGPTQVVFLTAEGRDYFMQAEAVRELLAQAIIDLNQAREELLQIAEKRESRRLRRLKRLGR